MMCAERHGLKIASNMSIFQRDVDASRPPRKQINAPRSNINSIIETKRQGGVGLPLDCCKFAGASGCARGAGMRREEGGPRGLPWRMRVDVSAGLRRMNEGRRVMLPRYCTARHERISKGGGGEGGWLPVPPPPPPPPPRSAPSTNASILYPDGFAKSPLSMSCYACRGPWWIP